MTKKTFLSLVLAATAGIATLPAAAFAESAPVTFRHQGVEYSYTSETRGDVRILTGTADSGKVPFRLRVSRSTVSGTFNHQPISFDRRDVRPILPRVDVAAR